MPVEEIASVDASQCQSENELDKKVVRCSNKPVWVVVEIREGKVYGTTSLCEEHIGLCKFLPGVYQCFKLRNYTSPFLGQKNS